MDQKGIDQIDCILKKTSKKTIAFFRQTCYITNSAFYCACLSTSNDED